MTDYVLNTSFDYANKLVKTSVFYTGTQTGFSDLTVDLYHPDGAFATSFSTSRTTGHFNRSIFKGSGAFGYNYDSKGYDHTYIRSDNSGAYFSIPYTNWELSAGFDSALFNYDIQNVVPLTLVKLPRTNGHYTDTPLIFTRGDSVLNGSIYTVSGGNYMTITNNRSLVSYTGYNFSSCVGKVISGSHSGDVFAINSYTLGSSGFYVDRDMTAYSGELVSIAPYRIVQTYSGWSSAYTGTAEDNFGYGGILARFGLNDTIPSKVGCVYYTSGTYSGVDSTLYHPYDDQYTLQFSTSVVALKNDTYLRDIAAGDILYYSPASNPLVTNSGVIIEVTQHGTAGEGDVALKYWPTGAAYTGSTYTVYRANNFHLQSYPDFGQNYMTLAHRSGQVYADAIVETPEVSIDFAANEFESTYASVSETSHFHFGPVNINNGVMLDEDPDGKGYPSLRYVVKATHGDVTSPSLIFLATGFSSQNVDAGRNFHGKYYSNGIFTVASSTAFNSSETIVATVEARYGSAKITRVISLPVQPAI